jgi:hypothetical protein
LSTSKTEFLGINESTAMVNEALRLGLLIMDQIKFVGAYVTKLPGDNEANLNFKHAFAQMQLVYRSWEWRHPIPPRAAIISKSIVVSVMMHLLSSFHPMREQLKEYINLIKRLLWKGRFQNQRLDQLVGRGGLDIASLIEFTVALRIRWYRQICSEQVKNHNWMIILQHWIGEQAYKLMT